MTEIATPALLKPADPNGIALSIGSRLWEGWQEIRVSRGCERVPNDFDLLVTERFPGAGEIAIDPGAPCELRIGGDVVVTGYVDRVANGISYSSHKVRVSGRGRCQDLVDCHIINDGTTTQIGNAQLLETARRLAEPYGIRVESRAGDAFIRETLSLFLTETPFDVIERLCRSVGFLLYEGADGNLILDRVSEETHATGFEEGANVEIADVAFSMDERFSEYRIVQTSLENLWDIAHRTGGGDWNTYDFVHDRGVPRRRRRTIVIEQNYAGRDFAIRRGEWEMARRYGRSQAVRLTVDSWRDGAGILWQPNRLAPLHLPSMKLSRKRWTIGEVTYRCGKGGEQADVTLMPPDAFRPQPIILRPFDNQVAEAVRRDDGNLPAGGASGGTP